MKIDSVKTTQPVVVNSVKAGTKADINPAKQAPIKKGDTLQISAEAAHLSKIMPAGNTKLSDIKAKVKSGYYDKPEVQKQTAIKMLKDAYKA